MRCDSWGDNISLQAAAQILHRPVVVWRRASLQRPTIVLNSDYDINDPSEPIYVELDETTRGGEHYSALLLENENRVYDVGGAASSSNVAEQKPAGRFVPVRVCPVGR